MRDKTIDELKGLGILLMLLDHACSTKYSHAYIQAFHMPLFFIISGFLYKKRSIKETIKRKFNTLMIPYISFSIIYMIIVLLFKNNYDIPKALLSYLLFPTKIVNNAIAGALWFLPCMFLVEVLYSIIQNTINNNRVKNVLIFTIAIMGFMYSRFIDFELPFCLEPMMISLLFMHMGYIMKEHKQVIQLSILPTIILFVIMSLTFLLNRSVDLRSARYHLEILYLFNGIGGTIMFWNLINIISKSKNIIISKTNNFLEYLSINAMTFICTNQSVIMILRNYLLVTNSSKIITLCSKLIIFFITLIVCYIINIIISNTRLRKIIGK